MGKGETKVKFQAIANALGKRSTSDLPKHSDIKIP